MTNKSIQILQKHTDIQHPFYLSYENKIINIIHDGQIHPKIALGHIIPLIQHPFDLARWN